MSGQSQNEVLELAAQETQPPNPANLGAGAPAKDPSFRADSWVWLNGKLRLHGESLTAVSAHGLHYGTGVFEGVRCYDTTDGPALFRMREHLDRFFASAAVYGIPVPYTADELLEATCEVIVKNGFLSCYVRPLCYLGTNSLGISSACPSEVAVLAVPDLSNSTKSLKASGIRAMTSSWIKFDRRMMPTTAKACGQYLNSVLASREAAARGFDEAILLNVDGNVAEATVANIFIVENGILRTNDESSSILPGITRDSVMQLARSLGYEVQIGLLRPEDLRRAEELFLTGTAREVVPVRELDGKAIGAGTRGPLTEKIQGAFDSVTHGHDPRFRHWLHRLKPQEYLRENNS
ncbi:MAG TPA: branched-chain amino acid transaminase [Candidatus Saccharimonadales bacterium]|nr:branched-chain amino acid transaminase [Candidatus Saccharimonadales bacterium]